MLKVLWRGAHGLLLSLITTPAFSAKAGAPLPANPPEVPAVMTNAVEPFDLADVKLLDSPFKRAMDLNARYLLSLEPDRFLHYIRVNAGLAPKAPAYGGWESPTTGAGRCLGHYLSALSLQYRATGDPRFKTKVDYIVGELAQCQQTNGFLSAQTNLSAAFASLASGHGDALLKSRVPWYVQHKMFAGLRDAFRLTGNEQARHLLIRLSDWAVSVTANLDREQFQIMLRQEYGGMLEVLVDAYALTGNRQYLELARRFRDDPTFVPLAQGVDRLDGMHANTMIPKITGAIRLYEWTGDDSQRQLADYFWNDVVDHHTYAIGGNSDHEHFGAPDQLSKTLNTETAETCNSYNMLKLTRDLFCLQPRVEYADFYERTLYNHILASQEPGRGMFTYFVSLQPGHFKTYSEPFDSFWCCVGTGMENHAQYGNSIYFRDSENLYVNLYIPSRLTWRDKNLIIEQKTDYPAGGDARFKIKCASPTEFTMKFRYPGWAGLGMTLKLNGRPLSLDARPGEFVKLAREWNNGDKIEIRLPLHLRSESLPDDPAIQAFFYGPLVLAGDLGATKTTDPGHYAKDPSQFRQLLDPGVPPLAVGNQPLEKWLMPVADNSLTFRTVNAGLPANIILKPFYQIYYDRYTVYWKVIAPP